MASSVSYNNPQTNKRDIYRLSVCKLQCSRVQLDLLSQRTVTGTARPDDGDGSTAEQQLAPFIGVAVARALRPNAKHSIHPFHERLCPITRTQL